jgi:hypothetical protein
VHPLPQTLRIYRATSSHWKPKWRIAAVFVSLSKSARISTGICVLNVCLLLVQSSDGASSGL